MFWIVLAVLAVGWLVVRAIKELPENRQEQERLEVYREAWESQARHFHEIVERRVAEMKEVARRKHGRITPGDWRSIRDFRQKKAAEEEGIRRHGGDPI